MPQGKVRKKSKKLPPINLPETTGGVEPSVEKQLAKQEAKTEAVQDVHQLEKVKNAVIQELMAIEEALKNPSPEVVAEAKEKLLKAKEEIMKLGEEIEETKEVLDKISELNTRIGEIEAQFQPSPTEGEKEKKIPRWKRYGKDYAGMLNYPESYLRYVVGTWMELKDEDPEVDSIAEAYLKGEIDAEQFNARMMEYIRTRNKQNKAVITPKLEQAILEGLKRGDVLYVPRIVILEDLSGKQPSFHIIVGRTDLVNALKPEKIFAWYSGDGRLRLESGTRIGVWRGTGAVGFKPDGNILAVEGRIQHRMDWKPNSIYAILEKKVARGGLGIGKFKLSADVKAVIKNLRNLVDVFVKSKLAKTVLATNVENFMDTYPVLVQSYRADKEAVKNYIARLFENKKIPKEYIDLVIDILEKKAGK